MKKFKFAIPLRCFLAFVTLAFFPFLAAPLLHAQSLTGLGVPEPLENISGKQVSPTGVSADGSVITGRNVASTFGRINSTPFRWENGIFTFFTGEEGDAKDISGDGNLIVGISANNPYVYDGSEMIFPDGLNGRLEAISENGAMAVGLNNITFINDSGREDQGLEAVRLRIEDGTVQGLGHLPWTGDRFFFRLDSQALGISADGSIVVGKSQTSLAIWEAFLWQNGSMVGLGYLPGGDSTVGAGSEANGVSNDGTIVVGSSYDNKGGLQAVRWKNRQIQTLNQGQETVGEAMAVSGDGKIIVGWTHNSVYMETPLGSRINSHAFIWTEEGGMRRLKDVLENDYGLNLSGWQQLLQATDISNDGSIVVGRGLRPDGVVEGFRAELAPLDRTLIVNRTGDEADHDLEDDACDVNPLEVGNQCTLRAAIQTANARKGIDGITFEIEGAGVHTITLGEALPALTEPLVLDATTQPGYGGTPLIQLTGTGEVGLDLSVGETRIRGLAIGGFSVAGIRITGPGGNIVEASYLGVGADGTTAMPNGFGLLIEDSPANVIGRGPEEDEGTQAKRLRAANSENEIDPGNVISGNTGAGLVLRGSAASGNVLTGNLIGTTAAGDTALSNGDEGVKVEGATETLIGGYIPEARNLISGNGGAGVVVAGEAALDNQVAGNFIGTNAEGTTALANSGAGVRITGSPGNTIGGDKPAMRNLISGNTGAGVVVDGAESSGNVISGNYIGTDAAGTAAIPNEAEGVLVEGAANTSIGTEALGNVIAGNGGIGVLVNGHLADGHANGTLVLSNIIGLDATGEVPMFNGGEAVIQLNGAAGQAKVGRAGAGNVIAGTNEMIGVELLDLGEEAGAPDGTQVAGNYIGVTKSGTVPENNLLIGVALTSEKTDAVSGTPGVVGGEDSASGNTIRATWGILIEGERSSNSVVAFNVIGNVDEALSPDDRESIGIWINGANQIQVQSNTIGGQTAGILLGSNESTVILNKIGTNTAGSAARPNTIGLWIPGDIGISTGDDNMIGNEEGGNVISGNRSGLIIGGSFKPFSTGKVAAGTELISLDRQHQFAHDIAEVRSWKKLSELPPDSLTLEKRVPEISLLQADENGEPDNNVIMLNRIGTNSAGNKEIGNGRASTLEESFAAFEIVDGTNNRLLGNLISGNGGGVYIGPDKDFTSEPVQTLLAGNIIGGSFASESANIPNQYGGVIMINSAGNRLAALPVREGGDPVGNVIRGNGEAGVQIGIIDPEDVGNQVRQSSFFDNKGPSIVLLNGELEYPEMAPQMPAILVAAAMPDDARLSFITQTAGTVDGFLSHACEGGHGQGRYMFSLEAEPGTNVVGLPYHQLQANTVEALDLYLALTITSAGEAGMTSEFSECYRIARESDVDSTAFSINDKGELINGAGIKVEVNSNADKQSVRAGEQSMENLAVEGMLYVTRYRVKPVEGPIDGTAVSPNGSVLRPDMTSEDRYWSLRSTGINSISYRVCLDIEELPGVDVSEQLVVLHRQSASQTWKPYDSTLENGQLCADGLTHFGEIGIGFGGNEGVNFLPFITTWKTDNPGVSNDQSIRIPMIGNGYDFNVDWGDGTDEDYNTNPGDDVEHFLEHTYASEGEYEVTITGDFSRIYFNNSGDREKILDVTQWGDIEWVSMELAFYGARNLIISAEDAPDLSEVTSMRQMFRLATSLNSNIGHWNTETITDMNGLFWNAEAFNQDIGSWNTGMVIDMMGMFDGAEAFNQDIGDWSTGSVENMQGMFKGAKTFNQDLNDWNTGNVIDMSRLFNNAEAFNGDISGWNTVKVETMRNMFGTARAFNQDISGWVTDNVTDMALMFFNTDVFNADIGGWNTSKVEGMNSMFGNSKSFNRDLSNWDVSGVTFMRGMFQNAESFNQSLGDWELDALDPTEFFGGMTEMLNNTGLSTENYDASLIGWADFVGTNEGPKNIELGAEGLTYCNGETARQSLIDGHNWTINDNGIADGCTSPKGEDQRILVSNAGEYEFSKTDFGISNNAFSIKIESLPDEGDLEYDGDPVEEDDELSIADINNDMLTWDPPSDEYGYNFTSFDFTIVDDGDVESEESYTMTIDLGTVFAELSGSEGWRFMSSPSGGDSYSDLFSGITVDLDFPTRQTLYELDQPNYDWDPVGSLADKPGTGTPFIVYVVDGDLPARVESGDNWAALDGTYSYSGLDFTDSEPNESSFYLVGNPHPIALDFCAFTAANVAVSVSLWYPAAGGGNGDYITKSCAVDSEVPIAPFQAFWVRTTDANPSLEIPTEAYLNNTTDGYFKEVERSAMSQKDIADLHGEKPSAPEKSVSSDRSLITLQVTSADRAFTNTAHLLFGRDATPALDTWDAPKLSPEGLAPKWLSFYSLDDDGRPYAIQSLPTLTDDQTRIPLDIQTTESGTFTLDWVLPESHQLNAEYYLRDHRSGEVIELTDGNSYRFEITQEQIGKTSNEVDKPATINLEQQTVNAQNEHRFELLITTDGSDGFAGLGDLPESFTLNQNYPNPFNPTTVISYELPQSVNVRLEVYDMAGRQVATLVSGQVAAGRHTVNFDASNLSSGVYLYRLQAGGNVQTRKLTILK